MLQRTSREDLGHWNAFDEGDEKETGDMFIGKG